MSENRPAADTATPPVRPRGRLVWKLLVVVIVVVLLDVIVGLTMCRDGMFLRWRIPPFDMTLTEDQRSDLTRLRWTSMQADANLGWTVGRSMRMPRDKAGLNAIGVRSGREYERETPLGVTRIAAFGDSFTFGKEVSDEAVWSGRIEAAHDQVEVLNYGVNGYGPDQAYLRYVHEGAGYEPDVVVIGMMVENIGRTVSVYRPAYSLRSRVPLTKPRFRFDANGELEHLPSPAATAGDLAAMMDAGELLPILDETDHWVQRSHRAFHGSPVYLSSFVRIFEGYREHTARRHLRRFYDDQTSEPYRLTVAILDRFYREATGNGAKAVVVIFPDRPALESAVAGEALYWQPLIDDLRAKDVEVVDLTPGLVEKAKAIGMDAMFTHVHYSPEGNAVVAEAITGAVLE